MVRHCLEGLMILALRHFERGLVVSRSPVCEGDLHVSLLTSPAFHGNNDGADVQRLPYPTALGIFS